MVEEEHEHDLSHQVFYHKNGYSLFRPIGGKSCKNYSYTPPQGKKAAVLDGGIDWINAADILVELSQCKRITSDFRTGTRQPDGRIV
jgi:hypothetical protein